MSDWSKRAAKLLGEIANLQAAGASSDEIQERLRRMRPHLVKPATEEWQKRLDEETYGQVVEKKDDKNKI